jgi:hypothetical protein
MIIRKKGKYLIFFSTISALTISGCSKSDNQSSDQATVDQATVQNTNTTIKTEINTKLELKEKLKIELEPIVRAELEAELEPLIRAELEAELEPLIRAELEPILRDELEAKLEFINRDITNDPDNKKSIICQGILDEEKCLPIDDGNCPDGFIKIESVTQIKKIGPVADTMEKIQNCENYFDRMPDHIAPVHL